MNSKGLIFGIIILAVLFSFSNCKKDEKYDFRDEFVGTYKGYSKHSMMMFGGRYPWDIYFKYWYTYDDTVIVEKDEQSYNRILIKDGQFRKTLPFIFKYDNKFSLFRESMSPPPYFADARFKSDSLYYWVDIDGGEKYRRFYGVK